MQVVGASRRIGISLLPAALIVALIAAIQASGMAEAPPAMVVAAIADDATPGTAEPHGPPATTLPPTTTIPPTTTTTISATSTAVSGDATPAPTTPPTTPAPTTVPPTTQRPEDVARARGEQALALINYSWQEKLPGWTISFHPGRSGVLGYTFVNEKRIEVYVRTEQSNALLAHVVAHELGHAVDVSRNSGDDRRRWQEARGIGDRPWWPGSGVTDFSTGAGDFAESFAAWQVGDGAFRSKLGGAPNNELQALMSELANG